MKWGIIWPMVAALIVPGSLDARKPEGLPSKGLDALFACSAQVVVEARVKCYDDAIGSLREAVAKRDVVVADREQISQTRRTLFGLALPKLSILGSDDSLAEIESTIDHAAVDNYGHFTFTFADGATWLQTDDNVIVREPHKGDKVVVKQGVLGSFKLSVRGQPAVKVRRLS